MFKGTITPLITPFKDEPGPAPAIDYDVLEKLIEWQLECGINGIVSCGSTGEAAMLTTQEKLDLIKATVEIVGGKIPVIAGTGSSNTKETVQFTIAAKGLGVDAALVVSPSYVKPTQEGLYEHFKIIAEESSLPILLYNIPGRTAVQISTDTIEKLAKIDGIVGIKHSMDSAQSIVDLCERCCDKLEIFSGEDGLVSLFMACGSAGVIAASANVIPKKMLAITDYALKGDLIGAFDAQCAAAPAIRALFAETNPIPAKAALKLMGITPNDKMRMLMTQAKESTKELLRSVLKIKK